MQLNHDGNNSEVAEMSNTGRIKSVPPRWRDEGYDPKLHEERERDGENQTRGEEEESVAFSLFVILQVPRLELYRERKGEREREKLLD